MPPVIVWGQCHDADRAADPIICKTAAEERPVATIMLNQEETNEQARSGRHPHETNPIAVDKNKAHQGPDDDKGHRGDHQFESAAHAIGLAITREHMRQRAGFRSALNHVWIAFKQMPRHVHQQASGDLIQDCLGHLSNRLACENQPLVYLSSRC